MMGKSLPLSLPIDASYVRAELQVRDEDSRGATVHVSLRPRHGGRASVVV